MEIQYAFCHSDGIVRLGDRLRPKGRSDVLCRYWENEFVKINFYY